MEVVTDPLVEELVEHLELNSKPLVLRLLNLALYGYHSQDSCSNSLEVDSLLGYSFTRDSFWQRN